MPNRILRDWTYSDSVDKISFQAEVLFTRLIMKADDYGSYFAKPKLINGNCFPLKDIRESDISRWLQELVSAGMIVFYTAENKEYLNIIDFNQRLRSMKKCFPQVPDNVIKDHSRAFRQQLDSELTATCPPEVETETEVETEVEIPPIIPQGDESDLFSDQMNEYEIKQPSTDLSKKVAPKKVFIPPSPDVVQEYCSERNNGISGEEFVNFYQSKGWMVGKNKMKDWQAAVRTWEQSRKNNGKSNYQTGASGNNTPTQQATYNIQEAAGRLAEDFAKGNIPGVYR